MSRGIHERNRVLSIDIMQRLEEYLRNGMGRQWVAAYDDAKTKEATDPTGNTGWYHDPEVDDVYAFAINGEPAIIVYFHENPDFECADWFETAGVTGKYLWRKDLLTIARSELQKRLWQDPEYIPEITLNKAGFPRLATTKYGDHVPHVQEAVVAAFLKAHQAQHPTAHLTVGGDGIICDECEATRCVGCFRRIIGEVGHAEGCPTGQNGTPNYE